MGNVKIISDGTPQGSKVILKRTGEEMQGVTDVQIRISLRGVTANIEVEDVELCVDAVGCESGDV